MDEWDDELKWERMEMYRREEEEDRIAFLMEEGQRAAELREQLEREKENRAAAEEVARVAEEEEAKAVAVAKALERVIAKDGEKPFWITDDLMAFCKKVDAKVAKGQTEGAAIMDAWREVWQLPQNYTFPTRRRKYHLWLDLKRAKNGREPTRAEYAKAVHPRRGRPPTEDKG